MSLLVDTLLTGWDRNLDYAAKLVADLGDDQMIAQPRANMNHPAWIFSHLNLYHPVIVAMLHGERFDDPKDHPFGMQSKPVADASVYPSRKELIDAFAVGHAAVASALRGASEAALSAPMTLERWRKAFPQIGSILGYLMLVHESTHLGQISAWRRVQGMPNV